MLFKRYDAAFLMTENDKVQKKEALEEFDSEKNVNIIRSLTSEFNAMEGHAGWCFVRGVEHGYICAGAIFENEADETLVPAFFEHIGVKVTSINSKEITFGDLNAMLTKAYFSDFIKDDDMFYDHFNLREFNNVSRSFGENLIDEKNEKEILSDAEGLYSTTLNEELARIFSFEKTAVQGHPCHYVFETSNRVWRKATWKNLLSALHYKGRLRLKRYTYFDINDETHFSAGDYEAMYRANVGGAIIVRNDASDDGEETEFARVSVGQIEKLAATMKKYRNEVLTIFVFAAGTNQAKDEVLDAFDKVRFVKIKESTLNAEEAKKFLQKRADMNGLKANDELFLEIEEEGAYITDELKAMFERWHDTELGEVVYPAYQSIELYKADLTRLEDNNSAYDELMEMIGLQSAKKVINQAIDYFKVQKMYKEAGLNDDRPAMNMVFMGNPGSAKTTFARLFAKILKEKGILESGRFVECGRADLVGKYVGWTAPAVKKKYKEARGGVLFIDEAYSLANENSGSFGQEAIDAIVAECENHRDDVITIFAGYPKEMEKFLNTNPGLTSRIAFKVQFDDYDAEELTKIAKLIAKKKGLVLSDAAIETLNKHFKKGHVDGNGRYVRNVIEHARMAQASRIVKMDEADVTKDVLMTIMPEDLELDGADKHGVGEDRAIGFC